MYTVKYTIFTPTFNRAYCLENLYKSLLNQTFNDFEWVVVDDGSTDGTLKMLNKFQKQGKLNCTIISQKNSGKHIAINRGIMVTKGMFFMIVDSDDKLPVNSLEIINKKADTILANHQIAGVVGRKAYFNGKKVGTTDFFQDKISNTLDIRFKDHLKGDLAEVFKSDILKEYPFPFFENERFCPEALVWNRITEKYKMLYFDDIVYSCEYLNDGLTAKIIQLRKESPKASMLYYSELEKYNIPFLQKLKANVNFWRFSFNSAESFWVLLKRVSFINSIIGLPFGFLMYVNDGRKL